MTASSDGVFFLPSNFPVLQDQPHPVERPFSQEEMLSALADGQLEPAALAHWLQAAEEKKGAKAGQSGDGDPAAAAPADALLECWSMYHLIGDVLRAPGHAVHPPADAAFLTRFQQALEAEEQQQKAQGPLSAAQLLPPAASPPPKPQTAEAANDPVFRWKLVSGFASLTAVCAVAWQMAGLAAPAQSALLAQQQSRQAPQAMLATTPAGPVLRDSRMEELLVAHRQHGGGSAVQMPGPFLRNALFAADAPGQ